MMLPAESVVAPLGSMTLVANVVIAPCMLKERVTRMDLFATFLIVIGCVLAVAFASHKDCCACVSALLACPVGVERGAVGADVLPLS